MKAPICSKVLLLYFLLLSNAECLRVDLGNVGWNINDDAYTPEWGASLREALQKAASHPAISTKGNGIDDLLSSQKFMASHRELVCPETVLPTPDASKRPKDMPQQKARQEIRNDASEPVNIYWWEETTAREWLVHEQLQPQEQTKFNTFVGDRFIVRLSATQERIVLDLTVGVRLLQLPEGLDCEGSEGILDPRPPRPPGPLLDLATLRGWANTSPCDLVGAWVNPTNQTERWMADLLADGSINTASHFEVTYEGHEFTFRLPDGRLVEHFKVGPARAPNCDDWMRETAATSTTRRAESERLTALPLVLDTWPTNATSSPTSGANSTVGAVFSVCPASQEVTATRASLGYALL
jgi:hypothetical protein